MKDVVNVPEERLNVVKSKETVKMLRGINVTMEDDQNSIILDGEGLNLYTAKKIVKSIARGFAPERAARLLEEESEMEIIDLKPFGERKMANIKSRIIGTRGKTRNKIEEHTKAYMSVYGKTITIIGTYEQIKLAKHAINMIIDGAMHATLYKFLERIE